MITRSFLTDIMIAIVLIYWVNIHNIRFYWNHVVYNISLNSMMISEIKNKIKRTRNMCLLKVSFSELGTDNYNLGIFKFSGAMWAADARYTRLYYRFFGGL